MHTMKKSAGHTNGCPDTRDNPSTTSFSGPPDTTTPMNSKYPISWSLKLRTSEPPANISEPASFAFPA